MPSFIIFAKPIKSGGECRKSDAAPSDDARSRIFESMNTQYYIGRKLIFNL